MMVNNIPVTESTEFLKPSYEGRHSIEETNSGEGIQKIWRYKNGYGASVVKFGFYPIEITKQIWNAKTTDEVNKLKIKARKQIKSGSYGQSTGYWEMAIISFEKDGTWNLNYKTVVSDDVIGYLNKNGIEKHLRQIKNLPDYQTGQIDKEIRNISDNFYHHVETLKNKQDIQSNCSECCFRLKGTFDEIKKSVLKMVECIKNDFIEYNENKKLTDNDKKILSELKEKIKKITKLEEFNFLMIDFTTNYETFFKQDNNDILVATCNNIDWDLVDAIPDEANYYSVRGANDYDVILVYEDKLLIKKSFYGDNEDEEKNDIPHLILVLNKDLCKYYMDINERIVEMIIRNGTYYILPFENYRNKDILKAEFCDDKELLTKLKIIANL